MDTLQMKKKQEEAKRALAIFCPKCTKKHPMNECPLSNVKVCAICEDRHPTSKSPSFPGLKIAYQGAKKNMEPLCFINQRRPGVPRPFQPGMPYTHP